MKRLNEKGDWKKANEIAGKLKAKAKVLQNIEKERAKNYQEIKKLSLELYSAAPAVDCLYGDSPLSPTRLLHFLTALSKKFGMDGVRGILTPDVEIKDFTEIVDEAIKWALKFENEKAS